MLEYLLWSSAPFAAGVGAGHYGIPLIRNTLQTRREERWGQEKKTSAAWDEAIETGIDRAFARDRLLDAIFHRSPNASNLDVDEAVRILHLDSPDIAAMYKCTQRLRGELEPTREAEIDEVKSVGTVLDLDEIRAIAYDYELFEAIEDAAIRFEDIKKLSREDLHTFRELLCKAYDYADDRDAMNEIDDILQIQDAVDKLIMAKSNLAQSAMTPPNAVWVSIHAIPPKDRIMGHEPDRSKGYQRASYVNPGARVRFTLPQGTYESLAFWTDEQGGRLLGRKQLPKPIHIGVNGSSISVTPHWELVTV
jgi:hypothetical protein